MEQEAWSIAVLVFDLTIEGDMPFHRADPTLLRANDGDWFFIDHRIQRRCFDFWRVRELRAPRAAFGLGPKALTDIFEFFRNLSRLLAFILENSVQLFAFRDQLFAFIT